MATPEFAVVYRDLPEFPGYRVGDDGSLWTCMRQIGLGRGKGSRWEIGNEWHRMKLCIARNRTGHRCIYLRRGGETHRLYVHRVVLETFIGPCPDGLECCHKDDNPANNALSNLRWGTRESNSADALRNGRRGFGEASPAPKLTEKTVRAIRADRAAGMTYPAIAEKHNTTPSNASAIARRISWGHLD